MKLNKTLGLAAASGLIASASFVPAANAQIELGEGFSATGFLDMSYFYSDVDGDTESDISFGIDQFEIDFMWAGNNGISAQVDVEYGTFSNDADGDEDTEEDVTFVEQAFVTKQMGDKFSVKAGRFLSYTGWETEEPTGLYQFSGAGYAGLFYGGYQQGISGMFDSDVVDVMFSFVNDAFDPANYDRESVEIEAGIAISPSELFTAKLFYTMDDGNDTDIINFWASVTPGNWTFAFEYNVADYDSAGEADGGLLMANVAVGNWGFTGRYSTFTLEDDLGNIIQENDAITLAAFVSASDNLTVVAEIRQDSDNFGGPSDVDSTTAALEFLFTF